MCRFQWFITTFSKANFKTRKALVFWLSSPISLNWAFYSHFWGSQWLEKLDGCQHFLFVFCLRLFKSLRTLNFEPSDDSRWFAPHQKMPRVVKRSKYQRNPLIFDAPFVKGEKFANPCWNTVGALSSWRYKSCFPHYIFALRRFTRFILAPEKTPPPTKAGFSLPMISWFWGGNPVEDI